ncbi:hypothetical protein JCM17843_12180 [Kordiimonadales bacterium JCM 17843]|nr:hypothetical protein JCM17843_12180 [Kordiimonadales bacterium JCM 17843]
MQENLTKPDYRVRLFLSVDLTGSTQFKSQEGKTNFDWLKIFQRFYGEFPCEFAKNYSKICEDITEICDLERKSAPKVWKTIGDEILFVNRINSITHLGACITAFSKTLIDFGTEINSAHSLNTKGNGWIAAFPHPNCSIKLSRDNLEDPLSGKNDILTEEFEKQVDENPHEFDFLGKGIDGGFRISRNATIDTFTISPALALLLCQAKRNKDTTKFNCDLYFHEMQQLKGVVNNNPYPIISIDTNRDNRKKEINELQSNLLGSPKNTDNDRLQKYLEKYIDYHGIEKPQLRLFSSKSKISYPEHYHNYIEKWELEKEKIQKAEKK